MIALYRLLMAAVLAVTYPVFRLQAARGSVRWRDRLALEPPGGPVDLWLHAASVGEVKVIGILVDRLLRERPGLRMHVTVMTPAGFRTAHEQIAPDAGVSYLPIDATPTMRRLIESLRPRMIIVAETEIWPSMILEATRLDIPLVAVNGRMSQKSFGRYRLVRGALTILLNQYRRLFVKSEEDAARFAFFEQGPDRTVVAGDMKFDAPLTGHSEVRVREVRDRIGARPGDFILVAGSTRDGEERQLLEILRRLRADRVPLRLVIAPRHVARCGEIEQMMSLDGMKFDRYADRPAAEPLVLVDKMGILNDLYAAADAAFVGGTLVNIGGHNILEPVWAGTPVLFGPSTANVTDAAEYVRRHNYGRQVASAAELADTVARMARGELTFAVKTAAAQSDSATAHIARFVLDELG